MATKHGHSYITNYQGADLGARFEFERLSDFAREVESSHGGLEAPTIAGAPVGYGTAGAYIDFTQTTLTTSTRAITSDDVRPDATTDAITVRYGGVYFCFLSLAVEIVPAGAGPWEYQIEFHINGANPAGAPRYSQVFPGLGAYYEQIAWTTILNVPDGGSIKVFRLGTNVGDSDLIRSAFLYVYGFRL